MAQTLLLGLGGTGARIVNRVVKELYKNGKTINEGEICCAVLDTNGNDNDEISRSGTGVPVIPTSAPKTVREYINEYSSRTDIEEWCPTSPEFLRESMVDGASELRIKSRIAFMDCDLSGRLQRELGSLLNRVRQRDPQAKLRIMIVSSLAGGTGSGMFIQVALWLRRFLRGMQIMIRGIFVLPDVFIGTMRDISANAATKQRHYANAYAAIKELNAISKVLKSATFKLPDRITIGDLFDSERDAGGGGLGEDVKVYDLAFFIDYEDANRITLESISAYESMAAQLVYMQLYSPMKDDMYSEEDNLFMVNVQSEDPLYGSCGVAKAEYPAGSVKQYCSIRAMQESLTTGWGRIDSEIDADLKEQRRKERDNEPVGRYIEPRSEYIRHFDEYTSVKPDQAGRDRFFLSIAKDVKNEERKRDASGNSIVIYRDKIEDFVNGLNERLIESAVKDHSGLNDLTVRFADKERDSFLSTNRSEQDLERVADSDAREIDDAIHEFEENVEMYASEIVNAVCTYSVGDLNVANDCSVYGMLTKGESGEARTFVHPVAARYLLYKLVRELQKRREDLTPDDTKSAAEDYDDESGVFDNRATDKNESTPADYFRSKRWYQSTKGFLNDFKRAYFDYMSAVLPMYIQYEVEALQQRVYTMLIGRVEQLIAKFEAFFRSFDDVQRELKDKLDKNIRETAQDSGRTAYVLGGEESKKQMYSSLRFRNTGDSAINKSVIHTLYGSFCAENRPDTPHNAEYRGLSVTSAFIEQTLASFARELEEPENRERIDLDIYTAIGRENEVNGHRYGRTYDEAFKRYAENLKAKAAEFITLDRNVERNANGATALRYKTFWGFSPLLKDISAAAVKSLGVNEDLQADEAYPKNELCCYRAVYGVKAEGVLKFRELDDPGCYYRYYKTVIDEMTRAAAGYRGDEALVMTPHLDKRWHKILPSISAERRAESEDAFYHAFWLAIAYGHVYANNGKLFISHSAGDRLLPPVPITENGSRDGRQLRATEVARLIQTLRTDMRFMNSDIPSLEEIYQGDIARVSTYARSEVMRGLTEQSELNPVRLMLRLQASANQDGNVASSLLAGLEKIAAELAEHRDVSREGDSLEKSKYYVCRMIYDSFSDSGDKERAFYHWVRKFAQYNLKETGKPAGGGEGETGEGVAPEGDEAEDI